MRLALHVLCVAWLVMLYAIAQPLEWWRVAVIATCIVGYVQTREYLRERPQKGTER